jgi:TRAP-type uncharacterized transport system fused permease subunit
VPLRLRDELVARWRSSRSRSRETRLFLGSAPDFAVLPLTPLGLPAIPVVLGLGVLAGVLGVLHNRLLLSAMDGFDRVRAWPAGMTGVGFVIAVAATVLTLALTTTALVGIVALSAAYIGYFRATLNSAEKTILTLAGLVLVFNQFWPNIAGTAIVAVVLGWNAVSAARRNGKGERA